MGPGAYRSTTVGPGAYRKTTVGTGAYHSTTVGPGAYHRTTVGQTNQGKTFFHVLFELQPFVPAIRKFPA